MPSREAFDLYTYDDAPPRKKRANRRHPGEGSSEPFNKKARAEDPPTPPATPTPTRNTTPPPPRNSLPPEQARQPSTKDLLSVAYNTTHEKLQRLSRHRRSQEAFSQLPPLPHNQGILTMGHGWRRAEEFEAKFFEEVKAVEARYAEQQKAGEEKNASLSEELRKHQEAFVKITDAKEKCKEASVLNFKEASKLQDDLVINRKETAEQKERAKRLDETNARNLEKYKGAAFKCFYLFLKSIQG
ncbi:uncharacterized protein LOC133806550 [Humulus lupulus]|uniref:uncharacterized protein LOC133806550 n=1 Tax=Humulus lupulus TaxID=3486 RepID=UPI002B415AE6|nr:uncharacterized protein LOC133806550 [Humulus lupulus]